MKRWAIAIAAIAVLALGLQVRWSPPNSKVHVDGTVFAYGGQRVLSGDLPYRDFWDHKPPGVYLLNALAFRVFGGADAWSIWYLTVVWTLMTGIAFHWLVKHFLSFTWALLGTIVFLSLVAAPGFYEGPNLTEFYGLFPSILGLAFTYRYFQTRKLIYAAGLGASLAASALLKPTGIASPTACLATILLVERFSGTPRTAGRVLGAFLAPVLISVAVVVGLWGLQGGLRDLWDANVTYNLAYADVAWSPRLLYGAVRTLTMDGTIAPLLILALGAILLLARWLPQYASGRNDPGWSAAECAHVAFGAALLLELLALSLLAYRFAHYYLAMLPALCVNAFYWFREESPGWPRRPLLSLTPQIAVGLASLAVWGIVVIGVLRPDPDTIRSFAADFAVRRPLRTDVGKYVRETTDTSDTVLWWGIGAELNFETGRQSPSRFVYSLPLLREGFADKNLWDEFLGDLRAGPPALIVSVAGGQFVPPLDATAEQLSNECQCSGPILDGLIELSGLVRERYTRDDAFESSFDVYRLKTD